MSFSKVDGDRALYPLSETSTKEKELQDPQDVKSYGLETNAVERVNDDRISFSDGTSLCKNDLSDPASSVKLEKYHISDLLNITKCVNTDSGDRKNKYDNVLRIGFYTSGVIAREYSFKRGHVDYTTLLRHTEDSEDERYSAIICANGRYLCISMDGGLPGTFEKLQTEWNMHFMKFMLGDSAILQLEVHGRTEHDSGFIEFKSFTSRMEKMRRNSVTEAESGA